ncbi:cyclase family protein [Pseudodesulfovibrio indicus]|uniref:Cyclase n=1 Tax=Pseudodesulfovibrio indicus TaxID=1716143 RepID=A0A126QK70_9BACT|nr:cyclase family protein [Pseudodesulfovibrio indicus]AMK10149.1 cyclase [Pseudodesulfovibrio indicus]TDT87856.1 kynurenine formamidase [Pseudodesulfovibrio indicus]
MKTIDLSHVIRTGMPVYPGDETPSLRRTHFIRKHGFAQTGLALSTHVGTHVDTAAHLFTEAPTLDQLGPDNFTGWGAVLDLTSLAAPVIQQPDLAPLADIDNLDFALLRTGWDQHWQTDRYYRDFPTLSETAARFLAGLGLKGVGLDTPSPDPVDSASLPTHQTLLNHGLVIVENLTRLGGLPAESFVFCCLPLRLLDGEASPCRAVGITF